jgi:hypothetical protein
MNKQQVNLRSLGNDYTIADKAGNVLKTIHLVEQHEILAATIGEYDENYHDSFDAYLKESKKHLSGFTRSLEKVCWYVCNDLDYDVSTVIEYAYKHGYDQIILEIIDNHNIL